MKLSAFDHLMESKQEELKLNPLEYDFGELDPAINSENVKIHYDVHTKGYFENATEKGDQFNINGLNLHNVWWETIGPIREDNSVPNEIIELSGKAEKELVTEWETKAGKLQGSGWVIMCTEGKIHSVQNHEWDDHEKVVFLLDCWEHAYYLTHPGDKTTYFKEMWKVYNWDAIVNRIN